MWQILNQCYTDFLGASSSATIFWELRPPFHGAQLPMAVQTSPQFEDMEAFLRVAKYPLVKYTDMGAEMREEAMDVCITAVEKYPNEAEKCTQVGVHRFCFESWRRSRPSFLIAGGHLTGLPGWMKGGLGLLWSTCSNLRFLTGFKRSGFLLRDIGLRLDQIPRSESVVQ